MQRILDITHLLCTVLASVLVCGPCGCGGTHDSSAASRSASPPAPLNQIDFRISFVPQAADTRRVDVWVDSSDRAVWSRLPARADDAAWQALLTLRLADGAASNGTLAATSAGMPGEYAVIDGRLRFRPGFPLLAHERYVAEFHARALPNVAHSDRRLTAEYQVPGDESRTAPEVLAIYPSSSRLPANHLKFYILFSQPMQQGEIWDYFTLLDETLKEPVPSPLRHTELWSEDGRRLTLWFHPGRQKTGVNLNVDIGPVLEAGHDYRLTIAKRWPAQNGLPQAADVTKRFSATAPQHAQLVPTKWCLSLPPPGTRAPLTVTFPQPLDWSLLQRELHVETDSGARVGGAGKPGPEERSWQFEPAAPWVSGDYRLVVGAVLEDLAGNSVARPFEVDVSGSPPPQAAGAVSLKFTITPPTAGTQTAE